MVVGRRAAFVRGNERIGLVILWLIRFMEKEKVLSASEAKERRNEGKKRGSGLFVQAEWDLVMKVNGCLLIP